MKRLFSLFAALLLLASCSNQTVISSQAVTSSSAETSSISLPESSSIAEQKVFDDIVFETYEFESDPAYESRRYFIDFPAGLILRTNSLAQPSPIIPEDILVFDAAEPTVAMVGVGFKQTYTVSGNTVIHDYNGLEWQVIDEPTLESSMAFFYNGYFVYSDRFDQSGPLLSVAIDRVDARTETSLQLTDVCRTYVNVNSERGLSYLLYIIDSIKIVEP